MIISDKKLSPALSKCLQSSIGRVGITQLRAHFSMFLLQPPATVGDSAPFARKRLSSLVFRELSGWSTSDPDPLRRAGETATDVRARQHGLQPRSLRRQELAPIRPGQRVGWKRGVRGSSVLGDDGAEASETNSLLAGAAASRAARVRSALLS